MNPVNGKRAKSSFALTILLLCLLTSSFILPAFADTALFDDQGTSFWTAHNGGTGSIAATITTDTSVVHSGSSQPKTSDYRRSLPNRRLLSCLYPNVDWSASTGVSFWLYGSNSGTWINFDILDKNNNYYSDPIQDNFNGWQQFTLNFATAFSSGNVDLKNINIIEFAFSSPAPAILYVDQMTLINAYTQSPSPSPSANPSPSPTVSSTASTSPSTHPTASPSQSTIPTSSPKITSTPTTTTASNPTSKTSQTASPQPTSSTPIPTNEPGGSLFNPFYPTFTSTPTGAPTSPVSSSMGLIEGALLLIIAIIIILTLTQRKRKKGKTTRT